MKIKSLLLLSVFAFIAALTLSQVGVLSAQDTNSPITSPISSFTYLIKGRVGYRFLNRVTPAKDVTVTAKNQNSGVTFSAKTDSAGVFSLTVNQASPSALYVIKPNDGKNTSWTPAQYSKVVSGNTSGLNFVGSSLSF